MIKKNFNAKLRSNTLNSRYGEKFSIRSRNNLGKNQLTT